MEQAGRERLKAACAGRVLFDEPLARHTSMGVGGPADVMVFPADLDDLVRCLRCLNEAGLPVTPVGNGTNLICRDGGVRGAIVVLKDLQDLRLDRETGERPPASGTHPGPPGVEILPGRESGDPGDAPDSGRRGNGVGTQGADGTARESRRETREPAAERMSPPRPDAVEVTAGAGVALQALVALALKEALAARHGLRPGQILPGNGSNQLLQTLLAAVIEPGEGLLYFPPTFGLFELFATINGAQTTGILCPPDRPFPLEEALAAIRTGAPRLILLCSPDNPTGRALSRPEVEAICQAAPGLVFLDEAYAEFGGWSGLSLLEQYPGLVLSRTFSKAFSMAGLRLGYLISHPANIDQLRKAHLPYTVNLLTEHIALRLLADPGLLEERVAWIVREREWLLAEMRRIAALLQHGAHPIAQQTKLVGAHADNVARDDRRRRLAEGAGFRLHAEIDDDVVFNLEIDRDS